MYKTLHGGSEMATASIDMPRLLWDTTDAPRAFAQFKQRCELIFKTVLKEADDDEKVSYILLWSGCEGMELYNSWTFDPATDSTKPDKVLAKFAAFFEPKANFRLQRYELSGRFQKKDEPIDAFISSLTNIALKCKFTDAERDSRVLDQLICGCANKEAQKILLGKDDKLTLDKAVDVVRTREATEKQMEVLQSSFQKTQVDVIKTRKYDQKESCRKCGKHHERGQCPAFGTTCNVCKKPNHWSTVCKAKNHKEKSHSTQDRAHTNTSKYPKKGRPKHKRFHEMKEEYDSDEELTLGMVQVRNTNNSEQEEIFATIQIKQQHRKVNLKCKVDTGAQGNIMPLRIFRELYPDKLDKVGKPLNGVLRPSSTILTVYGGSQVVNAGTLELKHCNYKGKSFSCKFLVTEADGPILLGLKTCTALQLITVNCEIKQWNSSYIEPETPLAQRPAIKSKDDIIKMYPECFDGIGCFPDFEYNITIDPNVKPVVHAPRRVPL